MAIISGYLYNALDVQKRNKMVANATRFLARRKKSFDGIAVRGVSGMLLGVPISERLNVPLAIIRKPDGNHSGLRVEGDMRIKRYVIIDDLIVSGDTISTIRKEMSGFNESEAVGIILYQCPPSASDAIKTGLWIKYIGMNADNELLTP